jgi:hypothetical protein
LDQVVDVGLLADPIDEVPSQHRLKAAKQIVPGLLVPILGTTNLGRIE